MNKKTINWTIEQAAREFGRSRTTVAARLADAGTKPGSDGKFTTKQICDAIFGSAHAARVREANSRARLADARTSILEKKWLPADQVEAAWAFTITAVSQRLGEVPSAVASGNAELERRIRAAIRAACEELTKMQLPEDFGENETEKNEDENDDEK